MKTLSAPLRRRFTSLAALALLAAVLCCLVPAVARASSDGNDDMVVFGGHQTVKEGQVVDGDLVVLGGSADVYGTVHGDAVAIGGSIYVAPSGQVDGSFVTLGGAINNESTVTPHTRVKHPTHEVPTPMPPMTPSTPEEQPSNSFPNNWTTFIVVDTVLVLLAFLLFPAKTRDALDYLFENPLIVAVVGVFSPIILALVLTALAITVIGIPLIPIVLILTLIGYLVGKAALAVFLGNRLFEVARVEQPKPIAGMIIGLLILAVVSMFSWEGVVIYFCIAAVALGVAFYGFVRAVNSRRRLPPFVPHTPAPPAVAPEFAPPAGPAPTGPPAVP